jgi:hypothetical protein
MQIHRPRAEIPDLVTTKRYGSIKVDIFCASSGRFLSYELVNFLGQIKRAPHETGSAKHEFAHLHKISELPALDADFCYRRLASKAAFVQNLRAKRDNLNYI